MFQRGALSNPHPLSLLPKPHRHENQISFAEITVLVVRVSPVQPAVPDGGPEVLRRPRLRHHLWRHAARLEQPRRQLRRREVVPVAEGTNFVEGFLQLYHLLAPRPP